MGFGHLLPAEAEKKILMFDRKNLIIRGRGFSKIKRLEHLRMENGQMSHWNLFHY